MDDLRRVSELLDQWDPIGVYSDPDDAPPPGEYERLAGPVLTKLRAGASEDEVADYLRWDARTNMGLTGHLDESTAAANLCRWWRQRSG